MQAPASEAKAALIGTYLNLGSSLKKDSEFQVVIEESGASLLGPALDYRMSFTLLPSGLNTRVVGEGALVKNNGTGAEQTIPANAGAPGERMQFTLNTIAAGFAAKKPVDVIVTESAAAVKAKFGSYYVNAPKAPS